MENRIIREEYKQIGEDLILTAPELESIRDSAVNIVFLGSDYEKKRQGRTVFGECEKIPGKYRWAIDYDMAIIVYEPNVERFTDKQLRILLLHELMHVGIKEDGNEETYYVVPHDVEDFRAIIDKYGMDWSET
jgi:hypothetical protein